MVANDKIYYVIFETGAGWIGLVSSSQGVSRTTLPQKSRALVELSLGGSTSNAIYSTERFKELIKKYKAYFQGDKVVFSEKLDLSNATPLSEQSGNSRD